jgi:hypothetical protein
MVDRADLDEAILGNESKTTFGFIVQPQNCSNEELHTGGRNEFVPFLTPLQVL